MIYAIEASGLDLIKIGRAKKPLERLEMLQAGCPAKLRFIAAVDWDNQMEWHLHQRYAASRVHGEWFKWDEDVDRFIQLIWCPYVDEKRRYELQIQDLGFHIVPRPPTKDRPV